MDLRRFWRIWAEILWLINSKSIKDFEAIFDVFVGNSSVVLPQGIEFEGTVDKRAPLGREAADEIKHVRIRIWALVGNGSEKSDVLPNETMP